MRRVSCLNLFQLCMLLFQENIQAMRQVSCIDMFTCDTSCFRHTF